ncbi:hypothetical protein Droror1_Dr00023830 [Drosera rotundifolia]
MFIYVICTIDINCLFSIFCFVKLFITLMRKNSCPMLVFGLMLLNLAWQQPYSSSEIFNVLDYGAVDDDTVDSSLAFLDAWDAACTSMTNLSTIIVPREATFLVCPTAFVGPCNANSINFQILGNIVAPNSPSAWEGLDPSQWLVFKQVTGLSVYGSGIIDGQGSGWWNQSCKYHPHLIGCTKVAPTALKFLSCSEMILSEVSIIDSPQTHVTMAGCNVFQVHGISISSPGNSPNTDGIHLQRARNVIITNSRIRAGDDCVSIGDYTSNINILNVTCGPGHGISIGSLGRGGNFVRVENINVKDIYLSGTTNGVRIKTWQVGRGYVRRAIFENLYFRSVMNPIIIDQNYCDVKGGCKEEEETGVWISEVLYKGVYGTSISKTAINLNCSSSVPCTDIVLDSIVLWPAKRKMELASFCNNAYGTTSSLIQPASCLDNSSSTSED